MSTTDAYLAIVRDVLETPGAPLSRARRSNQIADRVLISCADRDPRTLDHGQIVTALVGLAGELALVERHADMPERRGAASPLTMPTDLFA